MGNASGSPRHAGGQRYGGLLTTLYAAFACVLAAGILLPLFTSVTTSSNAPPTTVAETFITDDLTHNLPGLVATFEPSQRQAALSFFSENLGRFDGKVNHQMRPTFSEVQTRTLGPGSLEVSYRITVPGRLRDLNWAVAVVEYQSHWYLPFEPFLHAGQHTNERPLNGVDSFEELSAAETLDNALSSAERDFTRSGTLGSDLPASLTSQDVTSLTFTRGTSSDARTVSVAGTSRTVTLAIVTGTGSCWYAREVFVHGSKVTRTFAQSRGQGCSASNPPSSPYWTATLPGTTSG